MSRYWLKTTRVLMAGLTCLWALGTTSTYTTAQAQSAPAAVAEPGPKQMADQSNLLVTKFRSRSYCKSDACNTALTNIEKGAVSWRALSGQKVIDHAAEHQLAQQTAANVDALLRAFSMDHPEYALQVQPYIDRADASLASLQGPAPQPTEPFLSPPCSTGGCSAYYYICVGGCAAAAVAAGAACLVLPPPLDAVCVAGVLAAQAACSALCFGSWCK